MDTQRFGESISRLRKSRNKTQQQLADELFVTNKAVSKWESGKGLPDTLMLPAIASTLGVSVDELISSDDLQGKGDYTEKVALSGKQKARARKRLFARVAIIMTATLLLAFAIYNLIWFHYINNTYRPFIENGRWIIEAQKEQGSIDYTDIENRTWIVYIYQSDDRRYEIQVIRPAYLRFGGQVNIADISTVADPQIGEILGKFEVSFKGTIGEVQQVYNLSLHEWSTTFRIPLSSRVDRYGQPLRRNPEDSEEYFEKWLSLYERYYTETMEMIEYFTDFFGEEVLR